MMIESLSSSRQLTKCLQSVKTLMISTTSQSKQTVWMEYWTLNSPHTYTPPTLRDQSHGQTATDTWAKVPQSLSACGVWYGGGKSNGFMELGWKCCMLSFHTSKSVMQCIVGSSGLHAIDHDVTSAWGEATHRSSYFLLYVNKHLTHTY